MGTILIVMIHIHMSGWRPESAIVLPNLRACEAMVAKHYPYKKSDKKSKRAICIPEIKPSKE